MGLGNSSPWPYAADRKGSGLPESRLEKQGLLGTSALALRPRNRAPPVTDPT